MVSELSQLFALLLHYNPPSEKSSGNSPTFLRQLLHCCPGSGFLWLSIDELIKSLSGESEKEKPSLKGKETQTNLDAQTKEAKRDRRHIQRFELNTEQRILTKSQNRRKMIEKTIK